MEGIARPRWRGALVAPAESGWIALSHSPDLTGGSLRQAGITSEVFRFSYGSYGSESRTRLYSVAIKSGNLTQKIGRPLPGFEMTGGRIADRHIWILPRRRGLCVICAAVELAILGGMW